MDRADPYQTSEDDRPREVTETVLHEQRTILARQYDMMEHIDDRALRITRTSSVLLGIVLTGLSLVIQTKPDGTALYLPPIGYWSKLLGTGGIVCLVASIVVGILTTQYSRPIFGPGPRVRDSLRGRRSVSTAVRELADEHDDAITEMKGSVMWNRRLLWTVQLFFVGGLGLLVLSAFLLLSNALAA